MYGGLFCHSLTMKKYEVMCYRSSCTPLETVLTLDYMFIPKSTSEVMTDPNWLQMMVEEMASLHSNNT